MKTFIYQWKCEPNKGYKPFIRAYGLTKNSKTVCLHIRGFYRSVYVNIPSPGFVSQIKDLANESGCVRSKIVSKYYLYGKDKKHSFLKCYFKSSGNINSLRYKLREPMRADDQQCIVHVHEILANPILQFVTKQNIDMASWVRFDGKRIQGYEKDTTCDYEYDVYWNRVYSTSYEGMASPIIMSFDFEVASEDNISLPSNSIGDEIFMASCLFNTGEKIVLLTGNCDPIPDAEIIYLKTEKELIIKFLEIIKEKKPNIMLGYNILNFDLNYLSQRCDRYFLTEEAKLSGYNRKIPANMEEISWSSSAYGNQEFTFFDWEGILLIDLLPIARRTYSFNNYKLNTVAKNVLNAEKDDVDFKEIFKSFNTKEMTKVAIYCIKDSQLVLDLMNHMQTWLDLSQMSKATSVDMFVLFTQGQQIKAYSQLYRISREDNIVINHVDMQEREFYTGATIITPKPGYYHNVVPFDFAGLYPSIISAYNICYTTIVTDPNIPDSDCEIFEWEDHSRCEHDPTTKQIKVLNEEIMEIMNKQNAIRKKRDTLYVSKLKEEFSKEKSTYNLQKFYKKYPSIINQACAKKASLLKTWLKTEYNSEIKKLQEESGPIRKKRQELKIGSVDFITCKKRRFRFKKKSVQEGLLPRMIDTLTKKRKMIKVQMKQEQDPMKKVILDKQQLAYKVSLNSMYGCMGVHYGMLPLVAGAMCVTYIGRKSVTDSGKLLESFGAKLIYGDTDSNYCIFPEITDINKLWTHSEMMAEKVSEYYRAPMKLEFEEKIYKNFVIFSKKKYMWQECDRNGILNPKIDNKGTVLARRDNSQFLKNIFEQVSNNVFNKVDSDEIIFRLMTNLIGIYTGYIKHEDFVVTINIKDSEKINEHEKTIGDYKIRKLCPDNLSEYEKRKFYTDNSPVAVQLAERLRKRGKNAQPGTRVEYVVIKNHFCKKVAGKCEDYSYFLDHKDVLSLDKLYYLGTIETPLNKLLHIISKTPDLATLIVKTFKQKEKVLESLNKQHTKFKVVQ